MRLPSRRKFTPGRLISGVGPTLRFPETAPGLAKQENWGRSPARPTEIMRTAERRSGAATKGRRRGNCLAGTVLGLAGWRTVLLFLAAHRKL
jgi:hypothetical protein